MAQTQYHSGIDRHKRTSVICTVDDSGNVVREAVLKNDQRQALFPSDDK
jgi:hypothetical protein